MQAFLVLLHKIQISHTHTNVLLINPFRTQSPILAWLVLALVNFDFTVVSLETGHAGTRENVDVVMTTPTLDTRQSGRHRWHLEHQTSNMADRVSHRALVV